MLVFSLIHTLGFVGFLYYLLAIIQLSLNSGSMLYGREVMFYTPALIFVFCL